MKKMMMLTTTAYMSERFNRSNIEILESMGYEVHVVANFDKGNPTTKDVLDEFKGWVEEHKGKCFSISVTNNPFALNILWKSYNELLDLIKENNYEFIHCHTPVAGVLGRIVAHKTHTKVMYTAHGFHFFKGAPIINWMIYYPVERFLSRWTDVLITINQEDYQRAKKSFHAKQIEYIPGIGIDLEKFNTTRTDREIKRSELQLKDEDVMLFSVGELNKNKNHEIVIKAIAMMKDLRLHYYIAGQGNLRSYLENLSRELGVENQIHLLGFRSDIACLMQATDIFVFPSKREGLSVALMEAMASGLPCICSNIRGNNDLITSEVGGYRVSSKKAEQWIEGINSMLESFEKRMIMGANNKEKINMFSSENVNVKMKRIYLYISGKQ